MNVRFADTFYYLALLNRADGMHINAGIDQGFRR